VDFDRGKKSLPLVSKGLLYTSEPVAEATLFFPELE
jgi:hypothetical protein